MVKMNGIIRKTRIIMSKQINAIRITDQPNWYMETMGLNGR